ARLHPPRMAELIRGYFVLYVQKRDWTWIFIPRQIEFPEEDDVRIENAISLVRQRNGRGYLEVLLHMPAADRFRPERPPILAPLALNDAGQGPQPFGQKFRCRKHLAALACKVRKQRQVRIRNQQIMLRK